MNAKEGSLLAGDADDIPDLLEVPQDEQDPAEKSFDRPKVPITLLTGYLGAGKSTLLEYILTANHGYRIAVCMNDFGDTTDIEAKSLTMSDPSTNTQTSSMLSLPNGCLCCSFKDMGIAAIEEMVAQQRDKVDWVVVELTGVADPGPIAKGFWENEEMGDLILDGIVCVVDCRNILKQLAEERPAGEINEAQKQLAASDVIVLNKLDLVSPEEVATVEATVRTINPTLRVHKTTKSQVELPELYNLKAYASAPPSFEPKEQADAHVDCDHDHDHEHDAQHSHGVHQSGITTALVPLPTLSPEQFDLLNDFVEQLLWQGHYPPSLKVDQIETAPEILRCKGFIHVSNGRQVVLQGVTDLFELKDVEQSSQADVQPKVVFIGRGVNEKLRAHLLRFIQVQ